MLNEKVIGDYVYVVSDEHKVGTGQFGHVYKGRHDRTQQIVAIKQLDKKQIKGIFEVMVRNEIKILKQLDHPNILKLYAFYETANNIYIITEFCESDILSVLKQKGSISEDLATIYVLHLAMALDYLNSKRIVHRDIKPSNILLANGQVKLADFGFAIQGEMREEDKKFQVGSPLYMSPETLIRNQYSHKTDLWSLGILFYEMIFGVVPFFSMEMDDLMKKIEKYKRDYTLTFKHPISDESTQAIRNLLAYEAQHRCELKELAQIIQAFLRNRVKDNNESTHKKKGRTPEHSPQTRSKAAILNTKQLKQVNCTGAQSDKKITYFKKEKPKETIEQEQEQDQNTKRDDEGTERKENGKKDDCSYIREYDSKQQQQAKLSNEEFLEQYMIKLDQLIDQNNQNRQQVDQLKVLLYQYYGTDQKILEGLKLKMNDQQ